MTGPQAFAASSSLASRIAALDWVAIRASLDELGWARIERLLDPEEAVAISGLYGDDALFRKQVHMARHGFGRGEYRYFRYPLPELVATLRSALYPRLAPVANDWNRRLKIGRQYPGTHEEYVGQCQAAGQGQPTPLLLRYSAGDYNCLHQDLYGAELFPLQATLLLSAPGRDFTGGEFVMTEQRPRMQSRPSVVPLGLGDAVIFAVNERPIRGTRGDYRVRMRHGVSLVREGRRHALGVIFHDAA